jgi:flagellar biosynthesis/type III secretory pathway protein FliH
MMMVEGKSDDQEVYARIIQSTLKDGMEKAYIKYVDQHAGATSEDAFRQGYVEGFAQALKSIIEYMENEIRKEG